MRPSFRPIGTVVLTFLVIAFVNNAAYAVPYELDRPALISVRATTSVLLAVSAAGKRIVAVGERGIVLLSDDNGHTWRQAKVPVSVTLTAVHFATNRKGWAVGHSGVVLHTEDAGETWTKQLDGRQAAQLVFDEVQAKIRNVKGEADALKKQLALAQQLVDDGPDKPFFDIYFENEQSGYIVGAYNLIFRTNDGGATWQPWQGHVGNPRNLHLYGIRLAGKELYLAGEQGTVLRSKNGGKYFVPLRLPYLGTYFGLITTKNGGILVYGLRGNAFWSGDNGATWRKIETGVSLSITAGIELNDGTLLLVSQAGEILLSRDNGGSFQKLPLKEPSPYSGVAQSANGGLVLVGVRGVTLIPTLAALSPPVREGGK